MPACQPNRLELHIPVSAPSASPPDLLHSQLLQSNAASVASRGCGIYMDLSRMAATLELAYLSYRTAVPELPKSTLGLSSRKTSSLDRRETFGRPLLLGHAYFSIHKPRFVRSRVLLVALRFPSNNLDGLISSFACTGLDTIPIHPRPPLNNRSRQPFIA